MNNKKTKAVSPNWVMRAARPLMLVSAVTFLSGCAALAGKSAVEPKPKPVMAVQAQAVNLPEGSIRFDTESAEVAQLWSSAEQARLEENNNLALQRLFEALEYSPQNSLLWSRAAEIQLNTHEASLAENFAMKSNTFAGTNVALLHRNWLIIEHARSLRGDLLGVRSAHKKVQEFQYR